MKPRHLFVAGSACITIAISKGVIDIFGYSWLPPIGMLLTAVFFIAVAIRIFKSLGKRS